MSDATQTLHALFKRHHQYRREVSPEFATYEGDHRFNDRLSDLSAASEAQQMQDLQAFRAELSAIPREGLSHADQLNHDMFALLLDESIELHAFKTWQAPINQMTGYHLSLPQLIDIQPLKNADGYPDYLARLRAFPAQVAT